MGLISKQVSSDMVDKWRQNSNLDQPKTPAKRQNQQQQQPPEKLKCPRCDSTNTKFCYYNNYNKSQPRHFCKACKRHWTKGGTLRNVPVGGGRKNKRQKTSSTPTKSIDGNSNLNTDTHKEFKSDNQIEFLPLSFGDNFSQSLIGPPCSLPNDTFSMASNGVHYNGGFLVPPFSSTSFGSNPFLISSSFQPSSVYDYIGGSAAMAMEDSTITSTVPMTSGNTIEQPLQLPSCWNWGDIDAFVSSDLSIPWNDSEIKL